MVATIIGARLVGKEKARRRPFARRGWPIYLAQHPANGNYFLGSALVFWTVFSLVADQIGADSALPFPERVRQGFQGIINAVQEVNAKLQSVLHGLTEYLLDRSAGGLLNLSIRSESLSPAHPLPRW
jgi:hypothetical protein